MKTKTLLAAVLVGAAAVTANAGVHFGFYVGVPAPVVVAPPVVVTAPVYVAPQVPCPPVVVAAPPCSGVDYVWTPGYWYERGNVRLWAPGVWNHRPVYVARADFGRDRDWDRGRDWNRGRDHDFDHGRR